MEVGSEEFNDLEPWGEQEIDYILKNNDQFIDLRHYQKKSERPPSIITPKTPRLKTSNQESILCRVARKQLDPKDSYFDSKQMIKLEKHSDIWEFEGEKTFKYANQDFHQIYRDRGLKTAKPQKTTSDALLLKSNSFQKESVDNHHQQQKIEKVKKEDTISTEAWRRQKESALQKINQLRKAFPVGMKPKRYRASNNLETHEQLPCLDSFSDMFQQRKEGYGNSKISISNLESGILLCENRSIVSKGLGKVYSPEHFKPGYQTNCKREEESKNMLRGVLATSKNDLLHQTIAPLSLSSSIMALSFRMPTRNN
jgi:hypothetical protein